jgi:hypothetical protein
MVLPGVAAHPYFITGAAAVNSIFTPKYTADILS